MSLKIEHFILSVDHCFLENVHTLIFFEYLSDFVLLLNILLLINFDLFDYSIFLYSCFHFRYFFFFVLYLDLFLVSFIILSDHIHLNNVQENAWLSLGQLLRNLFHVILLVLTDLDLANLHQMLERPLDGIDNKLHHRHTFFESHIAYLLSNSHNSILKVDLAKYLILVHFNDSFLFDHFTLVNFLIILNTLLVQLGQYIRG